MANPRDAVIVAGVSAYMLGVAGWLRLTGRVRPRQSLASVCLDRARARAFDLGGRLLGRKLEGVLGQVDPWEGLCYCAWLPWWARGAESDHLGHSRLELYEDGRLLGPAHQDHATIAALGGGRYSHWQGYVRFSSSDGSDPRHNGRSYSFRVPS